MGEPSTVPTWRPRASFVSSGHTSFSSAETIHSSFWRSSSHATVGTRGGGTGAAVAAARVAAGTAAGTAAGASTQAGAGSGAGTGGGTGYRGESGAGSLRRRVGRGAKGLSPRPRSRRRRRHRSSPLVVSGLRSPAAEPVEPRSVEAEQVLYSIAQHVLDVHNLCFVAVGLQGRTPTAFEAVLRMVRLARLLGDTFGLNDAVGVAMAHFPAPDEDGNGPPTHSPDVSYEDLCAVLRSVGERKFPQLTSKASLSRVLRRHIIPSIPWLEAGTESPYLLQLCGPDVTRLLLVHESSIKALFDSLSFRRPNGGSLCVQLRALHRELVLIGIPSCDLPLPKLLDLLRSIRVDTTELSFHEFVDALGLAALASGRSASPLGSPATRVETFLERLQLHTRSLQEAKAASQLDDSTSSALPSWIHVATPRETPVKEEAVADKDHATTPQRRVVVPVATPAPSPQPSVKPKRLFPSAGAVSPAPTPVAAESDPPQRVDVRRTRLDCNTDSRPRRTLTGRGGLRVGVGGSGGEVPSRAVSLSQYFLLRHRADAAACTDGSLKLNPQHPSWPASSFVQFCSHTGMLCNRLTYVACMSWLNEGVQWMTFTVVVWSSQPRRRAQCVFTRCGRTWGLFDIATLPGVCFA